MKLAHWLALAALILPGRAALARSDCRTWKAAMSIPLSKELSPERLKELKQVGIDAVEFGLTPVNTPAAAAESAKRARDARAWAEAAGIEIWSAHIPFGRDLDISNTAEDQRQAIVRRISELLDVYAPLKVQKLVLHGSAEISKPIPLPDRQARIAAARKSMAELAQKASTLNAQIALECLPRGCLGNTSREVNAMIRGIPSVGVCVDMNHALQEKTEDFIRKTGSRIVTVHVSDYDGKDEKHWLPGKGINNWPAILRALERASYRGPFLFECQGTAEEKTAVWKQLKEKRR